MADITGAIAHLKARLGPVISDNVTIRDNHSHGESYHVPAAPDAVCFPRSTDDVVEIMMPRGWKKRSLRSIAR